MRYPKLCCSLRTSSAMWGKVQAPWRMKLLRISDRRLSVSWRPPVSTRITWPELIGEPWEPTPYSRSSLPTRAIFR
jgi:hypothetical protein